MSRAPLFSLTIRQKLIIGYTVMVVSVLIISLYAIVQLNRLNRLIAESLTVDTRIVKISESLLDSVLAQVSHERKYLITGEKTFKKLFHDTGRESLQHVESLLSLGNSAEKMHLIETFGSSYVEYVQAVDAAFAQRRNSAKSINQKRQQLIDDMSGRLRRLREISQVSLSEHMETSQEIGRRGTQVAVVMTVLTVLFGSVFAFFSTRSIYKPLQRLKSATRYISQGDFSKKIHVNGRDEISDLAVSFNVMCDRLRELDNLKADFISNITHDLKTPIASITEANQLILDGTSGDVTDQQKQLLNIIKEDAVRLLRLVETIIDLSKMESGLLTYDLQPMSISHPVISAIGSIKLLARRKQIRLSYETDKQIPPLMIDTDKVIQALINIMTNAIKFTPKGGQVAVAVRMISESGDAADSAADVRKKAVRISVSDTGTGIRQQDLPLIFDKFFRGHTAARVKGDGLGLTVVHHIVKAHGGMIQVESEAGKGSI
ncbi:MAG: HAMP domain-containing protein, partial [Deltaproteobacteria bacterium]|nr:HAMP domain-containing protein [Deltaproteobacteria bacterium]